MCVFFSQQFCVPAAAPPPISCFHRTLADNTLPILETQTVRLGGTQHGTQRPTTWKIAQNAASTPVSDTRRGSRPRLLVAVSLTHDKILRQPCGTDTHLIYVLPFGCVGRQVFMCFVKRMYGLLLYSSSTYFRGKNRFPANYWYHGIADFTLFPAVVRQKYREMRLHGRVVDGYGEVKWSLACTGVGNESPSRQRRTEKPVSISGANVAKLFAAGSLQELSRTDPLNHPFTR